MNTQESSKYNIERRNSNQTSIRERCFSNPMLIQFVSTPVPHGNSGQEWRHDYNNNKVYSYISLAWEYIVIFF